MFLLPMVEISLWLMFILIKIIITFNIELMNIEISCLKVLAPNPICYVIIARNSKFREGRLETRHHDDITVISPKPARPRGYN